MSRYSRHNALLAALAADGHLDVDEIAARLQVSASTIRRDLEHLSQQQLVTRTRGGAVASSVSYDLPSRYQAAKGQSNIARIGQAAGQLIRPGDIVGLGGGVTTTEVARYLANAGERITILTNAINIAGELAVRPHVTLMLTGGIAKQHSYDLVGPFAIDTLEHLDLDVAVIGADAIDPQAGPKALDGDKAQLARLMITRSRKAILVAASGKLRARAFIRICPWDQVQILVTDSEIASEDIHQIREHGVEVLTV
jgi:DeoR family transcriptional regulator of aga operon